MNKKSLQLKKSYKKDYLNFQAIFSEAETAFSRQSVLVKDLGRNFPETLIRSAVAKCLDFNIEANNISSGSTCYFFLMGNSRAICEELIYSAFFHTIGSTQSKNIAGAILFEKQLKSTLAQTKFFSKNNNKQPTLGSLRSIEEQEQDIRDAEIKLKNLWIEQGFERPPSLQSLARQVGLETTYGYVYHMSSNFVHFNPNQLLRLGWGPIDEGPFTFSVKHFEHYYSSVSKFLGAILFFGYCCAFPDMFEGEFSEKYIECITSRLEANVRWPEIITFEEMNQNLPNIIVRALISITRDENDDGFPNILSELKSLQDMN